MVLNPGKCHVMLIGHDDEPDKTNLNSTEITSSSSKKLLGVIKNYINLDVHIKSLCKKLGQTLSVLVRISDYLNLD